MSKLKCEICGGTEIIKTNAGVFKCQGCGVEYDSAQVKSLLTEHTESANDNPIYVEGLSENAIVTLVEFIEKGNKIQAIGAYREITGKDLAEAKEIIENLQAQIKEGKKAPSINDIVDDHVDTGTIAAVKKETSVVKPTVKVSDFNEFLQAPALSIVEAKCPNCGSNLEVDAEKEITICTACNTPFITEKAINVNNINVSDATIEINYNRDEFIIEDGVLLQYIGDRTTVKVPDGVAEIAAEAFTFTDPYGNLRKKPIVNLICPESVKVMYCSFAGLKTIRNFTAPGLIVIRDEQFKESGIEKIDCASVEVVGERAFENCIYIHELKMPHLKVAKFYAFNIWVTNNDPRTPGIGINKLELPSLEFAGKASFEGWLIEKLELPNLKVIEEEAFSYCRNLVEVNCPNVEVMYDMAFNFCSKLKRVYMPKAVVKNSENSIAAGLSGMYFMHCDNLTDVTLAIPYTEQLKHKVVVNQDGTFTLGREKSSSGGGCLTAVIIAVMIFLFFVLPRLL